jgi:hypothetical protein
MKIVKSFLVALILALTVSGIASASYIGPKRTVTTTTWERQYCNYRATITSPSGTCFLTLYFSPASCPSPASVADYFNNAPTACGTSWLGICGAGLSCNIALLAGSTQSCSSGETGCTQTTSTSTYPPATVSGTTGCAVPGNNGWCRGMATLNLSGNEPLGGYSITGIEGSTGMLCSGSACSWTFPEGITNLNFWALSSWGDTSTMASTAMMVDSLAPTLTLSIPPADGLNGWFVSGSVTASASATDVTSGIFGTASINGGGSSFNASAEGTTNLTAVVSDFAGNTASTSRTIRLDTSPPSLSVSVPPANGLNSWHISPFTLSGSGSDTTSGLASMKYRLDGGAWISAATCDAPEGVHGIEFQASDVAGNRVTISNTFSLDMTPPSMTVSVPTVDGSNGWYISPVTLTNTTVDTLSGVFRDRHRVDGGAWEDGPSATVSDGIHVVDFQTSDLAGNQTLESHPLSVDTTPPTVIVTLPPPQGAAGWYTGSLEFSAEAIDALSGVQDIAYSLDGGLTWQAGPLSLVEGRYTITTRVTDRAGNVSTSMDSVDVDPTPPLSTFTSPAEGTKTVIHGSFKMSGQTLDLTSGPSAAEISVDGGTTWLPLAIAGGNWSYTWDTNAVPNGTYVILVRASDVAGNKESTAQITVLVANQGPRVNITKTWWLWEQAEVSIQGTILPVTGARITISDSQGHSRTYIFNASNFPSNLKWDGKWDDGLFAPPGDFAVLVTAWDAFGNTGQDIGTVRIPQPLPTPTRFQPNVPTQTSQVIPTSSATANPTLVPQKTATAQATAPGPVLALGPAQPQSLPNPSAFDPVYIWPFIGLVGLLAAFSSSSWSDKRPAAIHRLESLLMNAASVREETKKKQTEKGEK